MFSAHNIKTKTALKGVFGEAYAKGKWNYNLMHLVIRHVSVVVGMNKNKANKTNYCADRIFTTLKENGSISIK